MKYPIEKHLDAMRIGAARLSAWADLLDDINVFPVADGDTGRNFEMSLAPLRMAGMDQNLCTKLLLASRGNSGNIACQFISKLLEAIAEGDFKRGLIEGRDAAYAAVANPRSGTMLTLFDTLVSGWSEATEQEPHKILDALVDTVRDSTDQLPELSAAGVVDAGALGMLIFFDGYFKFLEDSTAAFIDVASIFGGQLRLSDDFTPIEVQDTCFDAVLRVDPGEVNLVAGLSGFKSSLISYQNGDLVKVHLHADSEEDVRNALNRLGRVEMLHREDMGPQTRDFSRKSGYDKLHVMTDAAGSLTLQHAVAMNFTLLSSYVTIGSECFPEISLNAERMYSAMRSGIRVYTSQASVLERHESFRRVCDIYSDVIYLTVGSVFTGNFACAEEWRDANGMRDRFTVIDSGTASGSLGLIAYAAAHLVRKGAGRDEVVAFINDAKSRVVELIFLDCLEYLAKGGRISKPKAFMGDLMGMKPVITPLAEGVIKAGVARSRRDQVKMAFDRMASHLTPVSRGWIWLEYSDNRDWLEQDLSARVRQVYPEMTVEVTPVSLTSGAHMGPGTWGLSFLTIPGESETVE